MKSVNLLRNQLLLRSLDDEAIAEVSKHIRYRRFSKREFVVRKGEAGTSLLMLISGRLQVIALSEDGREIGLDFVEPNDYFGELSIIDGGPRSASVIATNEAVVGFLPKEHAQWLFYHHPSVIESLLKRLCNTIRQASNYRSLLGLTRAYSRVYSVLEATVTRGAGEGPRVIENMPNQHAIAIMANVSRETVSRSLKALQEAGVVEKQGRRMLVKDPRMLSRLAKGEVELQSRKPDLEAAA